MASRKGLIAMGGALYIGMSTATYLYVKSTKSALPSPCGCGCGGGDGLPHLNTKNTFDRIASDYDSNINLDETLMGVKLLRRFLLRKAKGDVVEVSAGTGRNLPYYSPTTVKSLTMTDTSREMLLRAHEKYEAAVEKSGDSLSNVSFCLADVEQLCSTENVDSENKTVEDEEVTRFGPKLRSIRRLPPAAFDTVVDTFGLCSCENPVQALHEMKKAAKPGGRLLLLEHGQSSWTFMNKILNSSAEAHFNKWGCWWNRDIEALIKEAGLEIEDLQRWHFGTTYVITAKPAQKE